MLQINTVSVFCKPHGRFLDFLLGHKIPLGILYHRLVYDPRYIMVFLIRFDDFSMQYSNRCRVSYSYTNELETLCAGIAFGADDILNGNSKMIICFDDNNVSINDWYDLTTTNAEQIRFYKNGRIDVRFKDSAAAESCFKRLRLDEITLREQ